jgi:hypothetical protein
MITPDGYNTGRDWLVNRALRGGQWRGNRWRAEVEWVEGLIEPGIKGNFLHPTAYHEYSFHMLWI